MIIVFVSGIEYVICTHPLFVTVTVRSPESLLVSTTTDIPLVGIIINTSGSVFALTNQGCLTDHAERLNKLHSLATAIKTDPKGADERGLISVGTNES